MTASNVQKLLPDFGGPQQTARPVLGKMPGAPFGLGPISRLRLQS